MTQPRSRAVGYCLLLLHGVLLHVITLLGLDACPQRQRWQTLKHAVYPSDASTHLLWLSSRLGRRGCPQFPQAHSGHPSIPAHHHPRACPSLAAAPYCGRAWSAARRRAPPPAGGGARRGHWRRPPLQTLRVGPQCSTNPPGVSPMWFGTLSPWCVPVVVHAARMKCYWQPLPSTLPMTLPRPPASMRLTRFHCVCFARHSARKCGVQRRSAPPTGSCSLSPLSPRAPTGQATALRLPVSTPPVWRALCLAAPATAQRGLCTASGRGCAAGTCAQRCSSCLRGPGASARSAIGCTHLIRCGDVSPRAPIDRCLADLSIRFSSLTTTSGRASGSWPPSTPGGGRHTRSARPARRPRSRRRQPIPG